MNQFLIIDSVFYACGYECAGTHVCMHVCGGQKTTLGVCVPVLYCFCSYGSVIWFEIRYCSFSSIFPLQDCFDYLGSFIWPYEVLDFFSNPISAKNVVAFFDFTESVDYFPNISSDDPWNRFLLGLLGFSTCPLFESFILEVLTSLVKFMSRLFCFWCNSLLIFLFSVAQKVWILMRWLFSFMVCTFVSHPRKCYLIQDHEDFWLWFFP